MGEVVSEGGLDTRAVQLPPPRPEIQAAFFLVPALDSARLSHPGVKAVTKDGHVNAGDGPAFVLWKGAFTDAAKVAPLTLPAATDGGPGANRRGQQSLWS